MRFATSLLAALVSLCSLQLVAAGHARIDMLERLHRRSPTVLAKERRELELAAPVDLQKRGYSGDFTFYKTGLGACGGVNHDGDFIVAMNHAQFDSGNWCGKAITITVDGKSVQATVVDRCEACGYGSLDFSPGLFQYFSSLGAGRIEGSWIEGSAPKPTPTPTPTHTYAPPPPPPTSTSEKRETTSTTTSDSTTTSTSTSTSATESSTATADAPTGNFVNANMALVDMARLLIFAAGSKSA